MRRARDYTRASRFPPAACSSGERAFTVAAAQSASRDRHALRVPTSGSATVPLVGGTYALRTARAPSSACTTHRGAYQGSLVAVSGASGNLPASPRAWPTPSPSSSRRTARGPRAGDQPEHQRGRCAGCGAHWPACLDCCRPAALGHVLHHEQRRLWPSCCGITPQAPRKTEFSIRGYGHAGDSLDFWCRRTRPTYTVRLMSTGRLDGHLGEFQLQRHRGAGRAACRDQRLHMFQRHDTGLTLNWPAVSGATNYLVLATRDRGQVGIVGEHVVSSPSYTFMGLSAGGAVRAIVSAINANGRGPGNETFQGTASS